MKPTSILITGVGGPAAINVYKSLQNGDNIIHMADASNLASGLYLVNKEFRHLLPLGRHQDFIPKLYELCMIYEIDVLIPTVDDELLAIAAAKDSFEQIGTRIMLPSKEVLESTLDKHTLLSKASKVVNVGKFDLLHEAKKEDFAGRSVVIKPRKGSGSRGVEIYDRFEDIPADRFNRTDLLIQERFEGMEYSVDMLLDHNHLVLASVPRTRLRTDSGVSVTGKVSNNKFIRDYANRVASALQLQYGANVQIFNTEDGPRLVEINPRFSGGLSLSMRAGADTPRMGLDLVLGRPVKQVNDIEEIAMVRYYEEVFTTEL